MLSQEYLYKWEAHCCTSMRRIEGFPFLQGLEGRKAQPYKWGAPRTDLQIGGVLQYFKNFKKEALEKGYLHKIVRNLLSVSRRNLRQICRNAPPCPSFPWSFRKHQGKPQKHQGFSHRANPWKPCKIGRKHSKTPRKFPGRKRPRKQKHQGKEGQGIAKTPFSGCLGTS